MTWVLSRKKISDLICAQSEIHQVSNRHQKSETEQKLHDLYPFLPLFLQGVRTSLGYAKCNVLRLRKVCERSELCLQNIDPIKRGKKVILMV